MPSLRSAPNRPNVPYARTVVESECFPYSSFFFFLLSVFSAIDLIEKALRKLGKRALRNEIDVTNVWLYSLSVSPTNVGSYSPVVTYFILACLANF
jgi:hypothetical protein